MDASRRLLVFGGTGFLGGRVVERANAAGWDVHATHLTADPGDRAGMWHRHDIIDSDATTELIESLTPSHIINAAYQQRGDHVSQICAVAPETMARSAAEIDAQFIHFSTDLVFDGLLGRSYREDDPVSPLGEYGIAKVDSERRVASAHPRATIVRTSLIYGEPEAPQERLVRTAHEHGEISFFIDERRTAVQVDDLATATVKLLDLDHTGLIHIAGEERLNRLEFAQLLAASLNLDPTALVGRTQDPALGPRAKDVSLDTSLAASMGLALPGPTARLG